MTPTDKIKSLKDFGNIGEGQPTVYIAGKVSGLPFAEVEHKFNTKALELTDKGYRVINPVDMVHPDCDWRQAMRICISFLPHADYIYLLPDWSESQGATLEYYVAMRLGIPYMGHSGHNPVNNEINARGHAKGCECGECEVVTRVFGLN